VPEPPGNQETLHQHVVKLKSGIRELTHEINNPLGVIRMATYFLEHAEVNAEKQGHYLGVINQSLDKVDEMLKRLKNLRESVPVDDVPDFSRGSGEQPDSKP
jgi:nitrogen-specific signal transduction histidine kinase